MATAEELRARRLAENIRSTGNRASVATAGLVDMLTEPGRESWNYAGNVVRSLLGADTVPFSRRPLMDATMENLGLAPAPAAVSATPAPAARSYTDPSIVRVYPGSTTPFGQVSLPSVVPAPSAPVVPAPAIAAPAAAAVPAPAPAPAPAAVAPATPQELPVTYEALRFQPQPAPIVPPSDPVYDRWNTPSGRRIDAFLERELAGGVGAVNQMLDARQRQQVYDMRRSPQWEAEYQTARRNVGDTAAAAIADEKVALATPGMSSAFEALLAPAARQAVQNARSEGAAVAAAINRPEANAPYYGRDFAAYGPIQRFDADAYGNPVVSLRGGGGQMTPFLALDNTTSNYGLGYTAGATGFPGVQERTDRSLAALTERFEAQAQEARLLAESRARVDAALGRIDPQTAYGVQLAREMAKRDGGALDLLGLGR